MTAKEGNWKAETPLIMLSSTIDSIENAAFKLNKVRALIHQMDELTIPSEPAYMEAIREVDKMLRNIAKYRPVLENKAGIIPN